MPSLHASDFRIEFDPCVPILIRSAEPTWLGCAGQARQGCAIVARLVHTAPYTSRPDARRNCAMSKARDLLGVLFHGGAHPIAATAAGLCAVLIERSFLYGPH
jgi:hypothetical protein